MAQYEVLIVRNVRQEIIAAVETHCVELAEKMAFEKVGARKEGLWQQTECSYKILAVRKIEEKPKKIGGIKARGRGPQ